MIFEQWAALVCLLTRRDNHWFQTCVQYLAEKRNTESCKYYLASYPYNKCVWFCWKWIYAVLIVCVPFPCGVWGSMQYLFVIYLFPVMIHWWVRKPSRGPNNCMFWPWQKPRARLGSRKTGLSPPSILILTVPMRYFCCGSLLLLVLAVRIYTLIQLLC